MTDRRFVGVVGSATADAPQERAAEEVGRLVAEAGAVLICGGLSGVMAAACRGAAASGGITVGILPGEDRGEANAWVTVPLATGLGELRNGLIVRTADVLVAVAGEYGTLSEVALALKCGRPVVGLGTWTLLRPTGSVDSGVTTADNPKEAVIKALALAGRRLPDGGEG